MLAATWVVVSQHHDSLSQSGRRPVLLPKRWTPTNLVAIVNALTTVPGHKRIVVAGTDDGIWLSLDEGLTWQSDRSSPRNNIFALAAGPDGTVYAGGSDGRVYVCDDAESRSAAWRPVSPPLSANPIFSVAALSNKRTLLVGSIGALYRGIADGGRWRWQLVARTADAAAVTSITGASWDPHLAFAAAFGAAPPVLVSHDDGGTWRPDVVGLPSTLPTQSLRGSSSGRRQLFLTTMGKGVWLRSARGAWHDISSGLPQHHAMPLITVPMSGVLYAGTMGYGVYEKQVGKAWRRLGQDLTGASSTVLSLAKPGGARSALLAGTTHGLFRYTLSQ